MQQSDTSKKILLVGNPNVGKSTIFNILCNRRQKTGNYAGVTVASLDGEYIYKNEKVEVTDLPGAYSIYPDSEDEAISAKFLLDETKNYSGIVYILEALNIKRGLLLLQQIQDLKIPVAVVLNQIDQAEKREITVDVRKLAELTGTEIICTNAKKNIGVEDIREKVYQSAFTTEKGNVFTIPFEQKKLLEKVMQQHQIDNPYRAWVGITSENSLEFLKPIDEQLDENDRKNRIPKRLQTQETIRRYQEIDRILSQVITKKAQFRELLTEKMDKILVHPFWGYVIFGLVLLFIFQMVFFLASYPMDWIDTGFNYLSAAVAEHLPAGPVNSMISNGIIPGIGGIVIFAPQIGILLYFLYLLEDSGYMARVVFLMDRFLRPFGLNGKSIVPLVSGTACAIPAIMSTRNIENVKERLITILVTPFMTCSARLPVYSIIIALVIPNHFAGGVISYRALALMAMYILGFSTALLASLILKNIIRSKGKSFLIMDLPSYKKPLFGYDFRMMLRKVWDFITGAGRIIFVVSIIIWVLSYFGPAANNSNKISSDVKLEHSYLARMGKAIEPAIAPLGYDWKMGVGILTSFAAREVFVGTMSTLYSLDEDAPETKVIDKMRNDVKPDGEKVFNLATGISILVFYAFAMQCISTVAVVYRETKSVRLTFLQIVAMSGLAYVASLMVYQMLK